MAEMTVTPVASHGFFLDGKWLEEGDIVDVRAPFDGAVIAHVYQGRREHAEAAIAASVKAFGTTRRLPAFERQRVLRRIADGIHDRRDEFSRTLAQEAGKPIKSARMEVERAIFTFNVAAEETVRGYGEYLPLDWQQSTAGRWGIVKRFPIGPVAGITPFNFPLNLVAHKVAPAIAAGCSIVLKPPSKDPLTMLTVAEIIAEAGLPEGAVSILPMSRELGDRMVADERFKLLTFTGSPSVGWRMKERAGKKKVVLELGGNAGVIIDKSADLDWAVKRCLVGAFSYAGQVCISVQRMVIHEDVWEPFMDRFVAGAGQLKMGDPLSAETDLGPMVDATAAGRTQRWVDEAVALGGKLLLGGHAEGTFFPPTILTETPVTAAVCSNEAFAPLV